VAFLLEFDIGWPAEGAIETLSEPPADSSFRLLVAIPLAALAGAISWSVVTFLGRYEFTIRRKPPSA